MFIEVNPNSGVPIYLQIKNQVKRMMATGMLKKDEPMTSVRQQALELRVNPNTIAKAYRELELEGYLYTKRGRGVFVAEKSDKTPSISKEERLKSLSSLADQLSVEAYHLGISKADIEKLLKEKFKKLDKQGER